jgi:hypothetical protein
MFGLACFSVTGFFLAFGVTVPECVGLGGYVECSRVSVIL